MWFRLWRLLFFIICIILFHLFSFILYFFRTNLENIDETIDTDERFNKIDLPYYSKYLLIAAYLASYISSKDDRLLFCRRALKKRKKSKVKPRTSNNEVNLLTGPKPFPLNRLLAIYFSIVEKRSNISATLLSQVDKHCYCYYSK